MTALHDDNYAANALDLLQDDHAEVDALFRKYDGIRHDNDPAAKTALVGRICQALTVHATIEEEIFYPAIRGHGGDDLLDEAAVEHQSLKDIIGRLEAAPASDHLYDAGVMVLKEYVRHHVHEEESELFPRVRTMAIDLRNLGRLLIQRKGELESRNGRGRARRTARASSATMEE